MAWVSTSAAAVEPPNVIVILLDDVGFAATQPFGGAIEAPTLASLAGEGVSYHNFNTTALCAPTRAALLSGRNHHRLGFGTVMELAQPRSGYDGIWPRTAASLAAVLRRGGYSTAAFGKWHNTPVREVGPMGPFERWPTGLGFEHFYGFMAGETSQWEPELYRNTTPVEPPAGQDDYHFTEDMVDQAIAWLRTQRSLAGDRPYFLYIAPGAPHDPHHAPRTWIDHYRGRFNAGWDALRSETFARQLAQGVIPDGTRQAPRDAGIPSWDGLSTDQRELYARQMEVFAAFLTHTDVELGRLLEEALELPGGDNTLVLYIAGDNGASPTGGVNGTDQATAQMRLGLVRTLEQQKATLEALGGPELDNNYARGWAWATSAPFRGMKGDAAHLGAVRNPLVIRWPDRIPEPGARRFGFAHVVDIFPTVLEAAGVPVPRTWDGVEQMPVDGVSLIPSLVDANALQRPRTQYFETVGNRALYHNGWLASASYAIGWPQRPEQPLDQVPWSLFNVAEDFSQSVDLAGREPERLAELRDLFDRAGQDNGVYPLLEPSEAVPVDRPRAASGDFMSFYPEMPRLQMALAPDLTVSHRIDIQLRRQGHDEADLLSWGGRHGGLQLLIRDDSLVCVVRGPGVEDRVFRAPRALPEGALRLSSHFQRDEDGRGGILRLSVSDQVVLESRIDGLFAYPFGHFEVGQSRVPEQGTQIRRVDVTYL